MATIQELNNKLDQAIVSGEALQAFDELYAEDVVMQENSDAPHAGKAFNRNVRSSSSPRSGRFIP